MTNRSVVRVSLSLLVLAGLVSCDLGSRFKARETRKLTVAHVESRGLRVEGRNGSIKVVADQQLEEVRIRAVIVTGGETQEEAEWRLEEVTLECARDSQDRLVAIASFPEPRQSSDGVSWQIDLPSVDGVNLVSSNGSITTRGLAGRADLRTSNGQIKVEAHRGDVTARTSNGAVAVVDASGRVSVDSSNGPVMVSTNEGPIDIGTSNASVTVLVGPHYGGTMIMSTSNGRVSLDDPGGRVAEQRLHRSSGRLRFASSGEASSIDTSNASITVRVRRD